MGRRKASVINAGSSSNRADAGRTSNAIQISTSNSFQAIGVEGEASETAEGELDPEDRSDQNARQGGSTVALRVGKEKLASIPEEELPKSTVAEESDQVTKQSSVASSVTINVLEAAVGIGKTPVKTVESSGARRTETDIPSAQIFPKDKSLSDSSSNSPSPKPSRLAARVRLIDGVVPRILQKGDPLPGDHQNVSHERIDGPARQHSSLNAGLSGSVP